MNLFISSSSKKLHWKDIFYKLYKIQKRLASFSKKSRKQRNLQRLIRMSFTIKLMVIRQLLTNSFLSTNPFIKNLSFFSEASPDYMNQIWEYNHIQLNILFLQKQTYCNHILIQIQQILWIFAFLPSHEKLSNHLNWQCRIGKTSWHMLDFLKSKIQINRLEWICFFKFKLLLSKKIKIWLLQNYWIEKKFLLAFFYKNRHKLNQSEQVYLLINKSISFKYLLKSFFLVILVTRLSKKIQSNLLIQKSVWILYTNLIIVGSQHFLSNYISDGITKFNESYKAFKIQSLESQTLSKGFIIYGWFIQKKKNRLVQQIYHKNIRSHQLEIKRFLKNAGNFAIDQVIYYLNQKIKMWKDTYLKNASHSIRKKLNNYLFWRIWYFLRKRHNTKGAKWVLQKYYLKQHDKKWVFQINQLTLISYNFFEK